jgi:hypothetical protein
MLGEIALTIGLPFCTVGVCLAVMGVINLSRGGGDGELLSGVLRIL